MGLDGSGALRLTSNPVLRPHVMLSSDGKWLYFSDTPTGYQRVSIDGGTPGPLFDAETQQRLSEPLPPDFHDPTQSPDGLTIAGHYNDTAAGGERILLVPASGGQTRRLRTVPPSATWWPDGKSLVYIEPRGGSSNLVRQPIAFELDTQTLRPMSIQRP